MVTYCGQLDGAGGAPETGDDNFFSIFDDAFMWYHVFLLN